MHHLEGGKMIINIERSKGRLLNTTEDRPLHALFAISRQQTIPLDIFKNPSNHLRHID